MLRAISVIPDARERHRSLYSAVTASRSNAGASPMSTVPMLAYRLAAVIKRPRRFSAQEASREGDSTAIQVFGSPCNGCDIRPGSINEDPPEALSRFEA